MPARLSDALLAHSKGIIRLNKKKVKEGAKLAHFGSLKITQEVREYAAQNEVTEENAIELGLKAKSAEFSASGGKIYHGSLPEAADLEHH